MFSFNNFDKRTIYIILGIFALGYILRANDIVTTVLTLPGILIAISFHEFAHAWMADRLGDYTPRSQGRLTLNPLAHVDPLGLILLLCVGIGWGQPVQINPNNFTSNKSRKTCEMLVSLAGPLMNLILAIAFTIIYFVLFKYAPSDSFFEIIRALVQGVVILNIGLGVFNLIPLPPLDGEKIFRTILPYSVTEWLDTNSYTIQIVFMVLWITGILSMIVSPIIQFLVQMLFRIVGVMFGVI